MNNSEHLRLSVLTLLFLFPIACTNEKEPDLNEQAKTNSKPLFFEEIQFEKASPFCRQDSNQCATIKAHFFLAKGQPDSVARRINDSIRVYLLESMSLREGGAFSLEKVAEAYFADYEENISQSGNYVTPWTMETDGRILYRSNHFLSYELDNYSYTGGAHPNSYTTLLNFDLRTGSLLRLEDLVSDVEALKTLVEKKFRSVHDLNDDDDFNNQGFFWDQSFFLPANYALTKEGLYFYYNPYEAASYVVGATSFTISRGELEGILKIID